MYKFKTYAPYYLDKRQVYEAFLKKTEENKPKHKDVSSLIQFVRLLSRVFFII